MSRRSLRQAASLDTKPRTATIRRALAATRNHTATDDLLFLEAWERRANPDLSALLRAAQIRRANPALAAELRAELARGRPLTLAERMSLTEHMPL